MTSSFLAWAIGLATLTVHTRGSLSRVSGVRGSEEFGSDSVEVRALRGICLEKLVAVLLHPPVWPGTPDVLSLQVSPF